MTVPQGTEKQPEDIKAAEDGVALEWNVGDVILDTYEVKQLRDGLDFAEGGFGRVYRVHHRNWNMDLAVKSPKADKFQSEEQKANFIGECERWINLGLHPNIVSCYYVRTLGGIPRVFAEYVEGGSLKDWIDSKRLYEGGHEEALKRILDIAIQFAWGLHYAHAHEENLVHQDVKPANVMMAQEGEAKVTDFGLAKARAVAGEVIGGGPQRNILVSSGGMTPAYCSPEQANHEPLSKKTDIWSWALSVLEVFTGEVTWASGVAAAEALQAYLETGAEDASVPKMPPGLASLLKQCFERNPDGRPKDMAEVAEKLKSVYEQVAGEPYAREKPKAAELLADGLNNRALSLLDLGKQSEANMEWASALTKHPSHIQSTYNSGLLAWRSGATTDVQCVEKLLEAVKAHPQNWAGWYGLGTIHLERGDIEASISALKQAAHLGERAEVAHAMQQATSLLSVQRRSGPPFQTNQHTDIVCSVSISRDGRLAFTAAYDGLVRAWDTATGQSVQRYAGHGDRVNSVCVSSDSQWVLSGGGCDTNARWTHDGTGMKLESAESRDNGVRLWDRQSGRCIRTLAGHRSPVLSVCLSVSGSLVASGSGNISGGGGDRSVRIWDIRTGRCVAVCEGHAEAVTAVCLSDDGHIVLSSSMDGTLRVWDTVTGNCLRVLRRHEGGVTSVSVDARGQLAASGGADGIVCAWDVSTGRCLQTFRGHFAQVNAVSVSRDGRWVVSGGDDRTVRIWDVAAGRCLRTLAPIAGIVKSVSIDARCASVLAGGGAPFAHQCAIGLSDVGTLCGGGVLPKAPWLLCRAVESEQAASERVHFDGLLNTARNAAASGMHAEALLKLGEARSLEGFRVAREALDLWSWVGLRCLRKSLRGAWASGVFGGHLGLVESVSLSSDGRLALSGSQDETGRLWEVPSGKCLRVFQGKGPAIKSVCLSSTGNIALTGHWDGSISVWATATGRLLQVLLGHNECVTSLGISSDDRFVLSASAKDVRLWEVTSGRCVRAIEGFGPACMTEDGLVALSDGGSGRLCLRERSSGRVVRDFGSSASCVCASASGQRLLAGDNDGSLRLYDMVSGRCLQVIATPGPVQSVSLSTDEHWALTAGRAILYDERAPRDYTVRLWELTTGRCARIFEGHTGWVQSVAFASDGRYGLSGSDDGTLRLWELDWDYEFPGWSDWDESARPWLTSFLTLHTPYAADLPDRSTPSEKEIEVALTRQGRPMWAEPDFQQLLHTLGCANYGWLRPEGVRKKLEEMTANWQGPPPLPWETSRSEPSATTQGIEVGLRPVEVKANEAQPLDEKRQATAETQSAERGPSVSRRSQGSQSQTIDDDRLLEAAREACDGWELFKKAVRGRKWKDIMAEQLEKIWQAYVKKLPPGTPAPTVPEVLRALGRIRPLIKRNMLHRPDAPQSSKDLPGKGSANTLTASRAPGSASPPGPSCAAARGATVPEAPGSPPAAAAKPHPVKSAASPSEAAQPRRGLLARLFGAGKETKKVGQDEPCPCGSGKKYEACCGSPSAKSPQAQEAKPPAQVVGPTRIDGKEPGGRGICSCGTDNPPANIFCVKCGGRLPIVDRLACPHCKKSIPAGVKFCVHCGKGIGG